MELVQSAVEFFAEEHRYELNGKELKGITGTIIKAVFGDYTKEIHPAVLQHAAERGTAIHEEIGRIIAGESFASEDETMEYVRLVDELGLKAHTTEYIVTDGESFASAIDIVYEGDIIADVKTTSELHYGPLALQLSWYKWMYERMNGRPVAKCYGIWLPRAQYGKCAVFEVQTQPSELLEQIIKEYLAGEDVTHYADFFTPHLSTTAEKAMERYIKLNEKKEKLEEEIDAVKAFLTEEFEALNVKHLDATRMAFTRIDPSKRITLDSKLVQKEYPEVWEKCKKETDVKGSVKITIKNK